MASNITPQMTVDKWKRNMTSAIPTIKAGIEAMVENPMAKAASREDAWLAGVQRAREDGSYRDGLLGVDFQQWKRDTVEKIQQRLGQGVQSATNKMQEFFSQLLPYTQRVKSEISMMPKGTEADSVARMMANFEKMKQFRFVKRRS